MRRSVGDNRHRDEEPAEEPKIVHTVEMSLEKRHSRKEKNSRRRDGWGKKERAEVIKQMTRWRRSEEPGVERGHVERLKTNLPVWPPHRETKEME